MPKRKRDAAKKKSIKIGFESCGFPAEIWERIVNFLGDTGLLKCAALAYSISHWLCFYVEHRLQKKKLSIISPALQRLYIYGDLVPAFPTTEPSPSSAVNLLNCFSTGNSVMVLPNLLADTLQTYVRYFVRNKRELAPNHLDICGLVPYDNCSMNLTPQGFYISVRIRLINDFPLPWTSYATHRFSPQDYIIRICQIRDHEGKFHPIAKILFGFFKNFKFNLEMYDSTDWSLGVIPKPLSRDARIFWSYGKKGRAEARRMRI